jgi:hypothetical protein
MILDWLSFSLPYEHGLQSAQDLFGDIEERPRGIKGYSNSGSICGTGCVGWHPDHPEQRVFVDLPSSALSRALEINPAMRDIRGFLRYILDLGAKMSRVDFALDDRTEQLSMDLITEHVRSGALVTRWRKGRHIQGTLEGKGETHYFGSPTSDSLLRIYDKQAEQFEKTGDDPGYWLRVEVQFRRDKAHAVVESYLLGSVSTVVGLLRGLIEFKEPTEDQTKARWPVSPWWAHFLDHADKMTLSLPKEGSSLERTQNWLRHQVAPSLAFVTRADGGSVDVVYDLIREGSTRLSPWQDAYLKLIGEHA